MACTVVAAGPGVTRFRVGDDVFGFGRGSFAEYTAAREDKLARMPANLTFEQAAVVPVSAVTALNALTVAGHVEAGQKVLVTGASGGVGSYAVQLARALGAEVTGVCSTAKVDLVRSLGAAHVIDYTQDDFADGAHRYDLIIDIAGNPTLSRLRRALTPAGTAVLTGGEDGGNVTGMDRQFRALALSPFLHQRLTMLTPASAPVTWNGSPSSSRPGTGTPASALPTHWTTSGRPCANSQPGKRAGRPPSPSSSIAPPLVGAPGENVRGHEKVPGCGQV